ncbi:MAG: hypothetical protein KDD58_11500 [Bdellovibrionales bacterium]|nr:hypothetical protein [Bdellovibrionales bacterium]
MVEQQYLDFLRKHKFKKNLLIICSIILLIFTITLLFVENIKIPVQRSWLIVPLLLLSSFSFLGAIRISKKIKFFRDVVENNQKRLGYFKISKEKEWLNGVDFFAEIIVENQNWELHLHPPFFDSEGLAEGQHNVEVLFDVNNRPAILQTNFGLLFISSARASR